jgi:hypothetical protein
MPIDSAWMKHSFAISKRWAATKKFSAEEDAQEAQHEVNDEGGTRFFLHVTFVLHFALQLINAVIQHHETPMYLVYITILHGPVLLFIVWVVQIFQQVVAAKFFGLSKKTHFDAILSPMGGLTMHQTTNVPQDVKVSLMIPLGHILLLFFWLALYVVFDGTIDETITAGVDFDELKSFWGLMSNIAAQAVWIGLYLVATHICIPVFPLSGASFFAACLSGFGLGIRKSAMIMDIVGALLAFILLIVGVQQTFFDDHNGIGVFVLFNSLMLVLLGLQRSFEPLDQHQLVTRSCYNEKECSGGEANAPVVEATESSETGDDGTASEAEVATRRSSEDFEEMELV